MTKRRFPPPWTIDETDVAEQAGPKDTQAATTRAARVSFLLWLPWRHAPLCAPATLGHTRDDGATNRIGIAELTDTAGVTGPAHSPDISTRSRGCHTNQA
jgi:hypothetical protein